MSGVIFVVSVHVVNIEKFEYLHITVKSLMCQADFLSDRNPWWLCGYKSQWSCCSLALISCLAGEVKVGKKHVFGSEGKVAGTDCQTLACALDIMVSWNKPYI